jgi:hypothetical protein
MASRPRSADAAAWTARIRPILTRSVRGPADSPSVCQSPCSAGDPRGASSGHHRRASDSNWPLVLWMVAGQGEAPVRELSPLQNATGLLRNTALLNDRMAAVRRAPRTRLTVWGAMPYRLLQTYL